MNRQGTASSATFSGSKIDVVQDYDGVKGGP